LYKRLRGTASPRTFSASYWSHPKPSSFSEPTAARVSATTIRFELVRPPTVCLSALRGARTRCVRPTSASHCFDYEYPYLVSYRHLFEACASPLADEHALATRRPVNLAFHDARFASAGFVGLPLGLFLRALPKRAVPLTPPSLPTLPFPAFAEAFNPDRQGRFYRHSVKMRRFSRPEVPSIVRGHSRACVNRCRSRLRSRDGFRYGPALGAPSLTAPRAPLSRRPWLRCARPPSPRIAPFRDFHAKRRHALLWVRLPPNDFCNYIPDVRTHPRAPDSRRFE